MTDIRLLNVCGTCNGSGVIEGTETPCPACGGDGFSTSNTSIESSVFDDILDKLNDIKEKLDE